MPTKDDLIHAAEMRAAFISFLNESTGYEAQTWEFVEQARKKFAWFEKAFKNNPESAKNTVRRQLSNLANDGLILERADGRILYYRSKGSAPTKETKEAMSESQEKVTNKRYKIAKDGSAIQIDIVKSTGRVRLNFNNLTVEIGVIDK